MSEEERRNELRYRMLLVLDAAERPVSYHDTLEGFDHAELRATASWLMENGYATWSGPGLVITTRGHDLITDLRGV